MYCEVFLCDLFLEFLVFRFSELRLKAIIVKWYNEIYFNQNLREICNYQNVSRETQIFCT